MRYLPSLFTVSLLTFVTGFSACAQDSSAEIPWPRLRELAFQFNEHVADKAFLEKYAKKINGRVQQRLIENNSLNEDGVLRSIMLDWAAGHSDKIVERDEQTVAQACYFLVIFVDKRYQLPSAVQAELTPGVVSEIMGYLERRVAEAQAPKSQPDQMKVVALPATMPE
jgi:hypothetical protein